jgi:cytidylate kinase
VIVTIDGPAGAGKSTVARALAARLGYRLLDTGAMYRAVTLEVLRTGADAEQVARGERWRAHLDDPALRGAEVNARVSEIARRPGVRAAMRAAQREFLAGGDAVAEGRDIGAVVWPDAELKVWLDADPAVRARRRGVEGAGALERDRRDAAQTIVPDGSVRIDTTGLSVEQVVDRIEALVR